MRKLSTCIIALGCVLIIGAFVLTGLNLLEDKRAGDAAQEALGALQSAISESKFDLPSSEDSDGETSDNEMSEIEIDGQRFIGIISIPGLKLELPVMADWSYPKMKLAPCRYKGSIYQNDMVIIGHNYQNFFRDLKHLNPGNSVVFTDSENNVFHYIVKETEQLGPKDVDKLLAGDWDLTLVTCTRGGQFRVTVRCTLTEVSL